jgi:pyruvate-ferredoxin/flavodoxin oxidoreductase
MDEVGEVTGRHYKLYEYYGHPEADRVTVAMGSATRTLEETCDYLNANGEQVGVMKVRLFRPFAASTFVNAFPESAKKISVLDRTREEGAMGMPLYLDTTVAFSEANDQRQIVGGQFGLASREFTPAMAKAVYDNLKADEPRNRFVVGVVDDVTHTSLDYGEEFNCLPEGTKQCVFWGFGTDGTVGANKQAIKTIGTQTPMAGQGHFAYDSHKGGGVTMSHLRFGPNPIKGEYEIQTDCDYIACHNATCVPPLLAVWAPNTCAGSRNRNQLTRSLLVCYNSKLSRREESDSLVV